MALAILKLNKRAGDKYIMEADIGTNEWYEYRIGKSRRKHRGLEFADEVQHQSSLIKAPVTDPASFQTSFLFDVSASLFDRDSRFIQLFSYKDRDKLSPAISEVLAIVPSVTDFNDDFKLPKMMSWQQEPTNVQSQAQSAEVRNTPMRVRENRVSEAMFFNALLGALPGLLTNALPMLGKILPAPGNAAPEVTKIADVAGKLLPELTKIIPTDVKPGAEGAQQVLKNISPKTIKAILEVIQAQMGTKTNGTNGHSIAKSNGYAAAKTIKAYSHDFAINPAVLMQLAPLLEKVLSPETIKAIGDNPVKLFKAVSDSALKFQKMELDHLEKINPGVDDPGFDQVVKGMARRRQRYSRAKIAPALLAALPALMPLLQKILSPDMIKAIGDQPVKLFNAIAGAGLKHSQQELEHLEKINPGVDDPAFDNIVNSMRVKEAVTINASFSNALSIKFLNAKTSVIAGKERVVYDKRQKITLPVQLSHSDQSKADGIKSISKGIFQLIIQDPDDMDVLLEKKYKLNDIPVGTPVSDIILSSDDVKSLPAARDLKVEVTFHWKKDKKTYGTFINHYITLTDGYLFQRTGDQLQQHFALNDVNVYRNYWHKVWEGGPTSHERWEVGFECKYYFLINTDDPSIKRLETRKKLVSDSSTKSDPDQYRRKMSARMKSGLQVSLEACNQLLGTHKLQPLSKEQLNALRCEDFMKASALAARVSVSFRGRKGETSALWTYPEGNFQSHILSKVTATDATGLVTSLAEEEVQFPKFSSVHFIGTQSE